MAALPCAGLRCIVAENKLVFLTLPPIPDGIAIFGRGFQAERLRELPQLTPDEQATYATLVRSNLRLEQERVSDTYAAWRIAGL
ncbi:MAG: hypothetical protein IPP13_12230 [Kouleothrix sp.]|nr:hypothetical protein [Kouleothrix sp.]